jgi:uncharacterized damage-inducible protein DinB
MTENDDLGHPSQAELLQRYLARERDNLVRTLDGLSEFDVRRPLTPSGTSLLGLVKHVASVTLGYFGECVGRPADLDLPWDTDEGFAQNADMWAKADESRDYLLDVYRRAWAHADESIRELGLDAPATVPWWPENRRTTTLGYLAVHMLAEVAHHAGHADILRESIDGRGGADQGEMGDAEWWQGFVARIQAEADAHREG